MGPTSIALFRTRGQLCVLQLLAKAGAHRLASTLSDVAILPRARTATARTSMSMTPDEGSGMSAVSACTALQMEGGT